LFDVNKLMEEQMICKGFVRNHNIAERNGSHRPLIGQVLETKLPYGRIEIRI